MAKMYFIAVVAPNEINKQVLIWKNYMKEHHGCVVALRSPAHITLIPPFWMDESLESKLISHITQFSDDKESFEIKLKDFSAFKPRVIFLHVESNEQLQNLQSQLQEFLNSPSVFPIKNDHSLLI